MPVVTTHLIGRFGNQCFLYCYSRAYAEKYGYDFQCVDWVGQKIFNLNDAPITNHQLPRRHENHLNGEGDIDIGGYAQQQSCLIYTRKQVKRWFTFRESVRDKLRDLIPPVAAAAHRRVGDYPTLGYVVVSLDSYWRACRKFGYDPNMVMMFTEENQITRNDDLPSFLTDFYQMSQASVLFRGNSSFSFWAATLSNAKIYAPVIEGLEGGKEQDCEFIEGNWPRFASLPFVTDLHLKEE
jgi:hypothetical protein